MTERILATQARGRVAVCKSVMVDWIHHTDTRVKTRTQRSAGTYA